VILSVVIPIYNVERYLPRCIESVLNQKIVNLEVILINDGSLDKSGEICNKYAELDSRVKVIHKQNGGLSSARNTGIENSKGKYIAFVDSDDYLSKDSLHILINEAEKYNLDIICGNYMYTNEKKSTPTKERLIDKVSTGEDYICKNIVNKTMSMAAPFNIYKKDLIINNSIYFKEGILHEDELWTPQVFLKANKVKAIDTYFYMYYIREGSITQSSNKTKNAIDLVNSCFELDNIYEKVENKQNKAILYDNLLMLYLSAVFMGNLIETPYAKKSFVLGKALGKRNKIKALLFVINKRLYYQLNKIVKYSPR
jgi:glycosyltransferase involved in cell wall biosynthesis